MPLAGIQANFGLDPRLRRSGVTSWVECRFHFLWASVELMDHFVVKYLVPAEIVRRESRCDRESAESESYLLQVAMDPAAQRVL